MTDESVEGALEEAMRRLAEATEEIRRLREALNKK